MRISIIIVNYNSGSNLKECIDSIPKGNELILVDNNSSDSSLNSLDYHGIKILKNMKNLGFAKAANQGIKLAKGEYLLLLNPDTILRRDTIKKTLAFFEKNKNAKIVGCRMINPDDSLQYSCRRFPNLWNILCKNTPLKLVFRKTVNNYLMRDYDHKRPRKVDWVSGAFLMMRGKYFFDEKFFMYFEDVDLCRKTGNVYYFPEAVAIHKKEDGSSKSLKLRIYHLKSLLYYFWKNL